MTETVTELISFGTLVLQAIILVCVLMYFLNKKSSFLTFLGKRGIMIAYLMSLVAMLGSLYYSEIARLEPCVMCWYQRIPMYANVFLLGMALFKKETVVRPYSMLLAGIGFVLAAYHIWLQNAATESVTCSLSGGASCSDAYFTMYGYITIPVIALTSFAVVIGALWLSKKYE